MRNRTVKALSLGTTFIAALAAPATALAQAKDAPVVGAGLSFLRDDGETATGVTFDLAQTIQTSYPHVKVLLTSGVAPFPDLPPGVALIKKPYFLFEVERRLVSLLEQAKDVRP